MRKVSIMRQAYALQEARMRISRLLGINEGIRRMHAAEVDSLRAEIRALEEQLVGVTRKTAEPDRCVRTDVER